MQGSLVAPDSRFVQGAFPFGGASILSGAQRLLRSGVEGCGPAGDRWAPFDCVPPTAAGLSPIPSPNRDGIGDGALRVLRW